MSAPYEVNFTIDMLAFYDRMACSLEEKRELLPLLEEMVQYSEMARRDGILVLDACLGLIQPLLLRKGLQLAVDGTDPALIRKILVPNILGSGAKGKDLLRQMLILEGVFSIQAGDNPRIVRDKLYSVLGAEFLEEAERSHSIVQSGEIADHKK